jgi:hypothetical protein
VRFLIRSGFNSASYWPIAFVPHRVGRKNQPATTATPYSLPASSSQRQV